MALAFNDWLKDVTGKTINNGQCWGLAEDYAQRVLGVPDLPTTGDGHNGYAIDNFDGYSNNGLNNSFFKVPAGAKAEPGSLVYWAWGTNYPNFQAPLGHVAIVIQDLGDKVKVLSQNSMGSSVAAVQTLPKSGLAGYLVPRNNLPLVTNNGIPDSSGNLTSTADTKSDPIVDTILAALGLKNNDAFNTFMTNVFLPGTWVRATAAFVGFFLIIVGFVLIVKDYQKTGGE